MTDEIKTSPEEKTKMERLGITSSIKQIYYYKNHQYDRLADALRYADRDYGWMREIE